MPPKNLLTAKRAPTLKDSRFHNNNTSQSIKALHRYQEKGIITWDNAFLIDEYLVYYPDMLRFPLRSNGEQIIEHCLSTAEKSPQSAQEIRNIPLIRAASPFSLTVFLQGHFWHLIFSGCLREFAPDGWDQVDFIVYPPYILSANCKSN
jgi:hypothetical protein